jgi:transcriptional regulator with XRE-family HTH domain
LIGGADLRNKKPFNVKIGLRIKKAREAAGYTQEKLAEKVGMGTNNISAIERGAVGISISAIQDICNILSISSDSLIMEESGSASGDDLNLLMERLKHLSPQKLELALSINNKLFEAFTIQEDTHQ